MQMESKYAMKKNRATALPKKTHKRRLPNKAP